MQSWVSLLRQCRPLLSLAWHEWQPSRLHSTLPLNIRLVSVGNNGRGPTTHKSLVSIIPNTQGVRTKEKAVVGHCEPCMLVWYLVTNVTANFTVHFHKADVFGSFHSVLESNICVYCEYWRQEGREEACDHIERWREAREEIACRILIQTTENWLIAAIGGQWSRETVWWIVATAYIPAARTRRGRPANRAHRGPTLVLSTTSTDCPLHCSAFGHCSWFW